MIIEMKKKKQSYIIKIKKKINMKMMTAGLIQIKKNLKKIIKMKQIKKK